MNERIQMQGLKRRLYLASFLVPLGVMLLLYIAMSVYPFGNSSLLTVDLGQQYVDFFAYLKHVLSEDLSGYFYSFAKGIGGDMTGVWAYYLMSPFNLVFLVLPVSQVSLGVTIVTLLKYGASGLAFSYLLVKRYDGLRASRFRLVVGFATAYALMGYAIANQLNIMWLDGVVWLPVIIAHFERLLDGEGGRWYSVSLGIMLMSNYYIGYMVCLFIVLYFFLYRSRRVAAEKRTWQQATIAFWRDGLRALGYSLVGVALAAVVLVPTFFSLLVSKATYAKPVWSNVGFAYNPAELVTKLFVGAFNYDQMPSGHPNLYVGILATVLFVGYFFSKRFTVKERLTTFIIVVFLLFSMNSILVNRIWHGGQDPVWYPYRYSFVLCFLMLVYAFRLCDPLPVVSRRTVIVVTLVLLAICGYAMALNFEFLTLPQIIVSSLIVLIILAVLHTRLRVNKWAVWFLTGLMVAEALANAAIDLTRLSYVTTSDFNNYQSVLLPTIGNLKAFDQAPFYRVEKTFMRSKNDAFPANYAGATHFGSTLESTTSDLFEKLGFPNSISVISYSSGTPVTDALFGIKYYVDSKDFPLDHEKANQWYRIRRSTPRKDITHYQKVLEDERTITYAVPQTLGLAFGVSSQMKDVVLDEHLPLENQQKILNAFEADDGVNVVYFVPFQFTSTRLENVTASADTHQNATFTRVDTTQDGKIHFEFTPKTAGRYYVTVAGALDAKKLDFFVNDKTLEIYETFSNRQVWEVASYQANQPVTFTVGFNQTSTLETRNLRLYRMNEKEVTDAIARRQAQSMTVVSFSNTDITGEVTITDKSDLLMTSIPYDSGWTVTIDGQVVEPVKVLDSLLAVPITPGHHTVRFQFTPRGWWLGVSLTATATALLFVEWWLWERRRHTERQDRLQVRREEQEGQNDHTAH